MGFGGMEVGERGRLYTPYRYTVTTRMTSAFSWAAMRAILMFHNCEGQSHTTVSTDQNFWRERRAEADLNRGPSAYQPNALPLGQTGSHVDSTQTCPFIVYSALWHLCSLWAVSVLLLLCGNSFFKFHFNTSLLQRYIHGTLEDMWHWYDGTNSCI